MVFNWDDYPVAATTPPPATIPSPSPAQATGGGFDWDAHPIAVPAQAPAAQPPGMIEAALRGAAHNAAAGIPEKAIAGGEAAISKLTGSGGGKSLSDLYGEKEAAMKAAADAAQAAHPIAYAAGSGVANPVAGIPSALLGNAGASAALRGSVQGATLGLGDEAAGGAEALYDKTLGDDKGKSLGDLYSQHTAEARAANAAAQATNPMLYGAGQLAGGAAATVGTMGAAAPATALGRIGVAAGMGAVNAVGSGNADNITDGAAEAAKGALIGGALGGAGEAAGSYLAGKFAPEAADALDATADKAAVKALGPNTPQYKELLNTGKLDSMADTVRDNGVVKSIFDSPSDKLDRIRSLTETTGEDIGDTMDTLDAAGVKAAPSSNDIAQSIEDMAAPMASFKSKSDSYNALMEVADDIKNNFDGDDFSTAQSIKNFLNSQVKESGGWNSPNPTAKNLALQDAVRSVTKEIEDGVKEGATSTGDSDLLNNYLKSKLDYGNSKAAEKILVGNQARELANQPVSLGQKVMAAGAVAYGNIGQAGLIIGGGKALKMYGNNAVALGADKLADIVRTSPEALGPFAGQLAAAAQRGSVALSATNNILSQTSEAYREHMRKLFEDQK